MLIPLSSFDKNPSNSRRHKATSRITKIVNYKRTLLLTIAILGIINYFRYSQQSNNNIKLDAKSQHDTKVITSDETLNFLYPPHEAHPFVYDYNPQNNNDQYDFFRKSSKKSPKVIEFYDPKCGACQAFKYNYIEIAKKIQEQKPNVQFYGVSCQVYKSTCDEFGVKRFPKILVFPDDDGTTITKEDGIEVPKGTGTIYFVTARLMKALRTKEEIEMDGVASSKFAAGR